MLYPLQDVGDVAIPLYYRTPVKFQAQYAKSQAASIAASAFN